MNLQVRNQMPPLAHFSIVHMGMASMVVLLMLYQYWSTKAYPYLVLALLAALFVGLQITAWWHVRTRDKISQANWFFISVFLLCILVIPIFVHNAHWVCLFLLVSIPLEVAATGKFKQLPSILFLIFVASATTILIDLVLPVASWRLVAEGPQVWVIAGMGFIVYLACLGLTTHKHYKVKGRKGRPQINVATQYALVFTGISAMVTILVTGVMAHQIRNAQINQVGKSFQTIAENFAKLVGSHLEQQTQKLQMLTTQVPIFKEALSTANLQYDNRNTAKKRLQHKNRFWQGAEKDNAFVMSYLNNPIITALSRFRGHNSFHNDLVLVDGYGGLVASLGQKPERFYFYDQNWWEIAWNGGLGNIFIGDLTRDRRTGVPRIRIAVDIVDHSTNKVIGMLSSTYLLRTLLEDIQHFMPDIVDQISLTDADGRVIASTLSEMTGELVWSQLSTMTPSPGAAYRSGWDLGQDHHEDAALIGFSTLSTAYNVISDPLHRLGWQIVVSGTRSNALIGVTQSTKIAMLVGLVAMALGVLGAIAAARVITRPIEDLTATASAMSEGDLGSRARLTGPEELVTLSVGFNRLTDQLHSVIRNLRSQAEQLARAKKEAEAATKLKGEFLANMSHEIRTPLNAILGFADILESAIEDGKQKRHAQTIKTSGADLLHLINDILDLSKIEAGHMEIQLGPVNLQLIFDDLQRIFSIAAEEKGIQLEMTVAPELPSYLILDRVRLRQVLFNLIGNAVKFTDQGWVRCRAEGAPAEKENAWRLQIEVQDTGIGIDPEVQAEIFETFIQHHHGEASSDHEGTGLGLAISKSLIEMMGGRIDVAGVQGKGARFTIHVPEVVAADEMTGTTGKMVDLPFEKKIIFEPASILVADDLEVNRRLIVEALASYPLEIDQAVHGKAAVSMAMNNRYDLILMDLRMPGMDGYGALEKIRRRRNGATTIVATTAAGMKEDIEKIQMAGFSDYLIRPFDKDALIRLLQRYLPHALQNEQAASQKPSPMTATAVTEQPPWSCPSEAEAYLTKTLKFRWEQVCSKQSIPDIIAFAREVRDAGERYHIGMLIQYGRELEDYAEGFDIYNVEKILPIYDAILSRRMSRSRKET